MSKILIYGHKGWIGEQVTYLLKTRFARMVAEVKLGYARVDDIESLQYELENEKPTHVMAFIGRTHGKIGQKEYKTIDYLEQPGKLQENVRDNLFSPLSLAILCQQMNIHFTYMGTGCIFEFDEDHPYPPPTDDDSDVFDSDMTIGFNEEDLPNFFGSSYSIVKGFTDRLMHLYEDSVLNVRIRMPITGLVNSRNFITKIVTYEKVCSIPNSMTVLPSLLPVLIDMALRKETGTINLVNPGVISHNEILALYRDIVDPNFTWKNFSIEEQARILAAGRSNNFLDTTKLTDKYPKVPSIRDGVIMCLKEMSENVRKAKMFLEVSENKALLERGTNLVNDYYFNFLLTVHLHVPVVEEEGLKKFPRKEGLIRAMKLATKPVTVASFTEFLDAIETMNKAGLTAEVGNDVRMPCVIPSLSSDKCGGC